MKKNPFWALEEALGVVLPERVEVSRSTFIDAMTLLFGLTDLHLIKGDPERLRTCRVLNELARDASIISFMDCAVALMEALGDEEREAVALAWSEMESAVDPGEEAQRIEEEGEER